MYNFEKKKSHKCENHFDTFLFTAAILDKQNYIITKLDNFNFSYLMNGTTDFNS